MPGNTHDASTKATIDELKKQAKSKDDLIKQLETRLDENWRLLNSRRYRAASILTDVLHATLRVTGVKAIIKKAAIDTKITNMRGRIDAKKLIKQARQHKGIIAHTGIPWDYIMRQRPHHIAPRLAADGYLFIYVDPDAPDGYRRWINENLLVVGGYDALEKLSGLKDQLPMYYISIAGFPSSFDDLVKIKENGFDLVYEYIDELDESINGSLEKQVDVLNRLEELEPVLVISSARRLYDQMAKHFPKEKLLLSQNAVEIEKFEPHKRNKQDAPKDMRELIEQGKPIVGYYGAIATWLDYKLIHDMAEKRPNYNFVFIGRDYANGLKALKLSKNIHYLGPKDYEELADYSYWFDCATIPFQHGEIAKSTSPLKLFEYMAMGIPTVCTRDLHECAGYDGVLMSKDNEQFIRNLDKAIEMKKDKKVRIKLIDYAKQNTWDARAKDMLKALKRLEG